MSTVLITQATGQQAQWTITHLLKSDTKIHAVVRDPQKPLPAILQHPSITIFKGDSTDLDSIVEAARGCQAVYLNTFPIPGVETQQAKTVCEAARKAGVKTIVVCTTFLTGDRASWDNERTREIGLYDYYLSKSSVEDTVRSAGFDAYTILRPGFIHFNYFKPSVFGNFPELVTEATLYHMYDDDARMPHSAGDDIGKYAAAALLDPGKYGGAEIQVGDEYLTVAQVGQILAKASGKDIQVKKIPEEDKEAGLKAVFARRFHLFVSGVGVPEKTVQDQYGIPFTSLEETFTKEASRLKETFQN